MNKNSRVVKTLVWVVIISTIFTAFLAVIYSII